MERPLTVIRAPVGGADVRERQPFIARAMTSSGRNGRGVGAVCSGTTASDTAHQQEKLATHGRHYSLPAVIMAAGFHCAFSLIN